MENSSETLKRLNNKLGGFGLLDGSRTPANWNGASFRNVSPFLQEMCDPTGQLLDHLIEPTSAAFFDKLHLRAQERILALLFQASPAQLQPVRAKIGALLARHQIPATNATSSKDELLSATWIPRLAAAAAEVHGFANGTTEPTTAAPNIIDQDATNILQLLAPPPPSASTTSASTTTTTTAVVPQHAELDALQQPQALEWAQWHANQRKTYDVAAVTHHLSKVGVSRHLPYEVLIGGKHKEDIVKTYHIHVPDCIQQLHATKFLGTDIDFTQKTRPMGPSGSSGASSSASSSASSASSSSSSSSASSADSHITNAQRQQQAQAARQQAAQDKAKKDAQVKANLARAMGNMGGSSNGGGVSGKRPRSEEGGGKSRTAVSLTVATNNINKKQAITNANGQPTSSPRNYTASLHESNLNTYLQLIKDNAPANRLALIKQNNEYMHRLKDFATGAPEKTGKLDPKTGKNKTFSAINLKLEDGYLYALHLDYKTLQCTIQKKKRASKKKK